MEQRTDAGMGAIRRDGARQAVRFEREYGATPDELWDALTAPEQLRGWLGELSGDLRPGGSAVLRFSDEPDQRADLVIERCERPHLLLVTWVFPGESVSTVTAELTPVSGGTRLVLDHAGLANIAPYAAGWHAYLDALAAVVAGVDPPSWDARFAALAPAYRAAAGTLS